MHLAVTEGVIAGVFVGGIGKRMGRRAKGLMEAPGGGTLVQRWVALLDGLGIDRVVLVGRHEEYEALGIDMIDDEPKGIGPLGGLAALLRQTAVSRALVFACDMPFVSPSLVSRLLSAPDAAIVAPRRNGHWEPLCARYDARRVLPVALRRIAAGQHALQPLLIEVGAVALPIDPHEEDDLRDWDSPEDVSS